MDLPTSRSGLNATELRQLVLDNESLFGELQDANMFITGATGWFGVWLLDVLCVADDVLALGLRITALSREPSRFLRRHPGFSGEPRVDWIRGEVSRLESVEGEFSHVIHAATDSGGAPAPDGLLGLFDSIVEGTRRVLATAGSSCRGLLLVSSGAIYGPLHGENRHFVESDVGGPDPSLTRNAYAEGKRAAEQLCALSVHRGVPARIARCFAFVGPHMPFDKHFAIGNFIADAVSGKPILIKSDGRPERSYLYMTDLVRALLKILINGAAGRAYNVGSDIPVTILQLAQCVDRLVGGQGVHIEGAPSKSNDRYVPDISRLKTELDFSPEVVLEEAILRTAAWYSENIGSSTS